jgi:histidine triad (HIT) family protein
VSAFNLWGEPLNRNGDPDCLFCRIISNEVAAARVYEDTDLIAFLDIRPLFPGHVLLCPRLHCPTLLDLPHELVGPMFTKAQLLTKAVEIALEAETVSHLHLHIVPRRRKDGLKGFFWPRTKYKDADAMEAVRAAIEQQARKLTR